MIQTVFIESRWKKGLTLNKAQTKRNSCWKNKTSRLRQGSPIVEEAAGGADEADAAEEGLMR